jgi:ascorbate PTS system EIIB component
MKKIRVMVVCGFGLGSSMILKMTLDKVLKEEGITAETFCTDEASAKGEKFDVVFTSKPLVQLFAGKPQPAIVINNFMDKAEVREKGLDVIRSLSEM